MYLWKSTLAIAVAFAISGCNDNSSGSSSSALNLPGSINLVSPGSSNAQASSQSDQARVSAFAEAGTEYSNFSPESVQVNVAGDEPIEFINKILCFVKQIVPEDNIDAGKYVAMVEEGQCFGGKTRYQSVTANVATSGPNFEVNLLWNDDTLNVDQRVRIVVQEGVSSTAPFGVFDMYMRTVSKANDPETRAHISVDRTDAGLAEVAISIPNTQAYATVNNSRTAGSAFTRLASQNPRTISMAFNNQFIKSRDSTQNDNKCHDKSDITEKVNGYALFYKEAGTKANGNTYAAGDEVEVKPGIGFTYGNDSKRGFISDWGHWTEEPLTTAETIDVRGDNDISYKLQVTVSPENQVTATLKDSTGNNDIEFGGEVDFGDNVLLPASAGRNQGDSDHRVSGPLSYYGRGTMGIFGSVTPPAAPAVEFSIRDGYELTSNSITYVVKAAGVIHELGTENLGSCDFDFPDHSDKLVDVSDLDTSLFQDTDFTEADSDPKYVNGELQQQN